MERNIPHAALLTGAYSVGRMLRAARNVQWNTSGRLRHPEATIGMKHRQEEIVDIREEKFFEYGFLLPYFQRNSELATEMIHTMRSKYNVGKDTNKRSYDGITFDSVMEMKYYRDVVLPLSRSGGIKYFELQKPYTLQPKYIHNGKTVRPIVYVADFYIEYADGRTEVIDVKGCADTVAKIKRKMFMYQYPNIPYVWMTFVKKWGGWVDYEEVTRLRREAKKAERKEKRNGK